MISNYPSWNQMTGSYSLKLLKRAQSSDITIDTPIERASEIGASDFLYQNNLKYPKVSSSLSYYLSDNSNELLLGFNTDGSSCSLNNFTGQIDRSLFYILANDGEEISSLNSFIGKDVIGVGNAYLTSYSIKVAVGAPAVVSVGLEGLNVKFDQYANTQFTFSGPSGPITGFGTLLPSIDLTVGSQSSTGIYSIQTGQFNTANYLSNQTSRPAAIRPGDTILTLQQPLMGGARYTGNVYANINYAELSFSIPRKDLDGFGSNYPYDKKALFPILGNLNVQGTLDDLITGNSNLLFSDSSQYTMSLSLRNISGQEMMKYGISKAKVENQTFQVGIGNNATFSAQFTFPISTSTGLTMSGPATLTNSISG